jgi:hypothetical protein
MRHRRTIEETPEKTMLSTGENNNESRRATGADREKIRENSHRFMACTQKKRVKIFHYQPAHPLGSAGYLKTKHRNSP